MIRPKCWIWLLLVTACGSDGTPAPVPAHLTVLAGDGQVVKVGLPLPLRLRVAVTDAAGAPVTGVTVAWAVTGGDGAVAPALTTTDATGDADSVLTAGKTAGSVTVSATVAGLPAVQFSATAKLQLNDRCVVPTGFPTVGPVNPPPVYVLSDTGVETPEDVVASQSIVADVDGNGTADLVELTGSIHGSPPDPGLVIIFLGDGHGGFHDGTQQILGGDVLADSVREAAVLDVNGDGRDDLYVGAQGHDAPPYPGAYDLLLVSQPGGTLRDVAGTEVSPHEMAFTHTVAAADVDCDGAPDVFKGSIGPGEAHILMNDGHGKLAADSPDRRIPPHLVDTTVSATASAFCDVDRDGDPDLVLGGYHHANALLANDGFGHFTEVPGALPPAFFGDDLNTPVRVQCADFDLDGWPDLFIVSSHLDDPNSEIALLHNRGDGTFDDETAARLPQTLFPQTGWLVATDLNDDGWPDLVTQGTIFINTGGQFVQQTLPTLDGDGQPLHDLFPADADGDGRVDLLETNGRRVTLLTQQP